MKKSILFVFIITLIIPYVAFASWWNPFTWEIFQRKEVVPQIEITRTPQEKIDDLQKQLDDLKNNSQISAPVQVTTLKETKTGSSYSNNSNSIKKSTPVVDICLNIEGIQTKIPDGYSVIKDTCSLILVKDLCPNIVGIQSVIPAGKFLYGNTNECLTEAEINEIDRITSEKKALQILEEKIEDKKAEITKINNLMTINRADFEKARIPNNYDNEQIRKKLDIEYDSLQFKSNILWQELTLLKD